MLARKFIFCLLASYSSRPWVAAAADTLEDLKSLLVDLNGSTQAVVDQFLTSWTGNGTFLTPDELNPGQKVEGFSLFRRACPLGNGNDCVPDDICCSKSDGAFCCKPDHPTCCGNVGDGWCCPDDSSCCGRNCCNPGYSCCGTLFGKANCCAEGQICCNQNSDSGHCCDEDQTCDSGGCIDPTTTIDATTTVIKTESDKTTITVTSNTTVERTSTSESVKITTLSNVATATVVVTKTKTITDSSSTIAKRWAASISDPTTAAQAEWSPEGSEESLQRLNKEPVGERNTVYLRARPSLDAVADLLLARDIPIQRRDTVTETEWETETSTYVSTSTITSTEWETEYTTSVEVDYVTRSSYIAADTTVTSTTTTTIHIAAGSTESSGDDNKDKDDDSSDDSKSKSSNNSSSSDKGAIIGGAVGGAAGVVLLAIVAFLLWRRRKRSSNSEAPNVAPQTAVSGTHNSMISPPQSPQTTRSNMQQINPEAAGIYATQDNSQDPKRGQSPWQDRGSRTHMQAHEVDAGYPARHVLDPPVHEADTVYPYERSNIAELDSHHQGDMAGVHPPRYGY